MITLMIIAPKNPGTISYRFIEDFTKMAQTMLIRKPLHIPAMAPALVILFHSRERTITGQKAAPIPDQAKRTNQKISLFSDKENQKAAIAGAVSGAKHVHYMAGEYGVPVILHTDHAAKKLLPWIDGMLDAGERHHEKWGRSLYSSHMLDLSEEPLEENIAICKRYLKRMSKMEMTLEIELGVTGFPAESVILLNVKVKMV